MRNPQAKYEGMAAGYMNASLPRGSIVVPFWGSYLESYKLTRKRNYYGAYGYRHLYHLLRCMEKQCNLACITLNPKP